MARRHLLHKQTDVTASGPTSGAQVNAGLRDIELEAKGAETGGLALLDSADANCTFTLRGRPNLKRVEIEVSTRCNLACHHCDRRCSQAPEASDMTLAQLGRFVAESQELDHRWEKIGLLGGEPAMHPEIHAVVELLGEHFAHRRDCEFFLVSNAHGTHVRGVLAKLQPKIRIVERPKTNDEPWFNNMDLAPVDLAPTVASCPITAECGLAFTARGYFPCGAGAGIARALDRPIGIPSLHKVTEDAMVQLLAQLCKYCGHALAIPVRDNPGCSSFWARANANYRQRRALHPGSAE